MTPILTPEERQKDKRKGKTLSWREAKLCLAHAKGSQTPVYAGTIEGGFETAGRKLFACPVRAGFGANSNVHTVGDGAPWIVSQVEEHFGAQGSYLIDFYHVCEYLSAAAKAIAQDAAAQDAWMDAQKEALKTGRLDKALAALAGHIEAPEADDDQAPVRRCHRYLSGRRNHLNYRDALATDRLRRDRKRASLYRAATPETARSLVAGRTRRIYARATHQPSKRRLGGLLGYVRQNRLPRQSEPTGRITKSRSVSASLWIAPLLD